jgi:N-formylglutamate amidohydrolase
MILHIPHSSPKVTEDVHVPYLQESVNLMTDWYADELFQFPAASRVVFDLSRLVVDVERLPNDPMEDHGKGRFYSTDVFGYPILRDREMDHYGDIYRDYHTWFSGSVHGYLSYFPVVVIVDCHTFNNNPLNWEAPGKRPDICIGVNGINFPHELVYIVTKSFEKRGLSVAINRPYVGSIVPEDFIGNNNVYSIMIEVNKSLYLNNKYEKKKAAFRSTQFIITEALRQIDEWESKKEDEFWRNCRY